MRWAIGNHRAFARQGLRGIAILEKGLRAKRLELPQIYVRHRESDLGGRTRTVHGVIMCVCVHSGGRTHACPSSNVAALHQHMTTWALSDEGLQKDADIDWVIGRSWCQDAGGEILLSIFGTNDHVLTVGVSLESLTKKHGI